MEPILPRQKDKVLQRDSEDLAGSMQHQHQFQTPQGKGLADLEAVPDTEEAKYPSGTTLLMTSHHSDSLRKMPGRWSTCHQVEYYAGKTQDSFEEARARQPFNQEIAREEETLDTSKVSGDQGLDLRDAEGLLPGRESAVPETPTPPLASVPANSSDLPDITDKWRQAGLEKEAQSAPSEKPRSVSHLPSVMEQEALANMQIAALQEHDMQVPGVPSFQPGIY